MQWQWTHNNEGSQSGHSCVQFTTRDMAFMAHVNRILDGHSTHLALNVNSSHNRQRCRCGSSSNSYPHWPLSTIQESFNQLNLLHDRYNSHRRMAWWLSERENESIEPRENISRFIHVQGTGSIADAIQSEFRCINDELDRISRLLWRHESGVVMNIVSLF